MPTHTTDNPITYRALAIFLARNHTAAWGTALDALLANPGDARESVFAQWGVDADFYAALDILADLGVRNAADCRDDLASWRHEEPSEAELAHWIASVATPPAPAAITGSCLPAGLGVMRMEDPAPGARCMCGWRGAHLAPNAACPNCGSLLGVTRNAGVR